MLTPTSSTWCAVPCDTRDNCGPPPHEARACNTHGGLTLACCTRGPLAQVADRLGGAGAVDLSATPLLSSGHRARASAWRHAPGGGGSAASPPATWLAGKLRAPSKYEARRLAETRAAHKERATHARAVAATAATAYKAAGGAAACGSAVQAPPAFVASPVEVVFTDVLAGATQRAEVALINRGATKASIRLVEVAGEVRRRKGAHACRICDCRQR